MFAGFVLRAEKIRIQKEMMLAACASTIRLSCGVLSWGVAGREGRAEMMLVSGMKDSGGSIASEHGEFCAGRMPFHDRQISKDGESW